MSVKKIVLTGGPCAGKTTAKDMLMRELSSVGYKVIFVPESATEILEKGVNPETLGGGEEGLYLFQKAIFQLQYAKEQVFENIAETYPSDKVVLVYDRGLTDAKGFAGNDIFGRILYEENKNEFAIRDKYDAVFHLVTAAKGAEQFYGNESNEHRREGLRDAITADENLLNAWIGHPHLRVITNEGKDFEQKMQELLRSVKSFLGEPISKEMEHKFLIEYPNEEMLLSNGAKKSSITQIYLKEKDGVVDRRIRQRTEEGHSVYTYTEKRSISNDGLVREEREERISEQKYLELLKEADYSKSVIVKDRYCLMMYNTTYEIDIYPFWNDRAIMEVEVEDENDFINIPGCVDVVREITNEQEYKNVNLAKNHDIYEPELSTYER